MSGLTTVTWSTADVGHYSPNAWGLFDVHGNVWEWTRSQYRPYPYTPDDGRDRLDESGPRVVRGGSWYDRPKRCRSGFRWRYSQSQQVFNVGFRIVIEASHGQELLGQSEPHSGSSP